MGTTPASRSEAQPPSPPPSSSSKARQKAHSLMGQVLDLRRLRTAYEAVRANGGAPGVDGVTVEAFRAALEDNLRALVSAPPSTDLPPAPGAAGAAPQA